jgi:crotonobetainyl-CoA:carnitine CoA-transferase CaiB-like acyl-CoA transferase
MLADVTIAEIGDSLSVAYCGRMLADAGARVIRLGTGQPFQGDSADPDYAAYLHAGKRLAALAAGTAQALRQLAREADVVVCDSRAAFDRLRALRAELNPGLIVVCVSDYGLAGPEAGTAASELTLQTEAGIAVMRASASSPPFVNGLPLSQLAGGVQAAIGAVQGLLARAAGGERIDIDVSRFESLVWLLTFPWDWEQVEGHAPYWMPIEGHAPFIPPMNTGPEFLPAKDGWVCLSANVPAQWASLKAMMAIPELDDPRFDQVSTRAQYLGELSPLMQGFTTRHTVEELVELARQHRVPASPVCTVSSAYLLPPYAERGSTVTGVAGDFRQPRPAFRFTTAEPARAPGVPPSATPALPLRGLRVVAFEVFHAGPLVTQYLAGLGAEVIKIEAVNRPDLIRYAGVPGGADRGWERSATFIALNVGKRGITADLTDPAGVGIVRKLVATADVVLDNFVPRTLDSRDLDYAGLRQLRPDVIMTRMPGWGLTGSWSGRAAYTELVESASGTASLTATDDGVPHRTGTVFDPMSSALAVFATLVAIRHRQVTGEGAQAEIALCDSVLQFTAPAMIRASQGKEPAARRGNRSSTMAPQGIYQCDGAEWAGLTIASDAEWAAFAGLPGAQWAAAVRFASTAGRFEHHDELDVLVAQWSAGFAAADLVALLRAAGIAAARLTIGAELIDHPQLRHRGRVFAAPHPVVGQLRFIGYPARMSTLPVLPDRTGAPTLGRDNAVVLAELGYSAAQIAELADGGAIGSVPYARPEAPGGT